MNKILGAILVIFVFNTEFAVISNAADAGYLGDQLMNYIKAKYLAKKYNIPFQLRPFQHAEKLLLYDLEPRANNGGSNITVQNESQIFSHNSNIFYVSYYCKIDGWRDSFDTYTWQSALEDEVLINQMRQLIALKNDIKIDFFPDGIMVAVHVRCHIGRIRDIQSRILEDVINELTNNYLTFISQVHEAYPEVTIVLSGVVPPSNAAYNLNFPFYGTLEDRVNIARNLNSILQAQCSHVEAHYIDAYAPFCHADGSLNTRLGDGVHIWPAHNRHMLEQLKRILGL